MYYNTYAYCIRYDRNDTYSSQCLTYFYFEPNVVNISLASEPVTIIFIILFQVFDRQNKGNGPVINTLMTSIQNTSSEISRSHTLILIDLALST
jgi:hypothetical protein